MHAIMKHCYVMSSDKHFNKYCQLFPEDRVPKTPPQYTLLTERARVNMYGKVVDGPEKTDFIDKVIGDMCTTGILFILKVK